MIQAISGKAMYGSENAVQAVARTSAGNNNGNAPSGTQKSTTTNSSSFYYDVRDTNHDGFVSLAEEIAYELTHPNVVNSQGQSKDGIKLDILYNQQGRLQTSSLSVQNLIDISV